MNRRDFFKRLGLVGAGAVLALAAKKVLAEDRPRVLLTGRTDPTQNGIYEVTSMGDAHAEADAAFAKPVGEIQFKCYEHIDTFVGNVKGIRKLELYSGGGQ